MRAPSRADHGNPYAEMRLAWELTEWAMSEALDELRREVNAGTTPLQLTRCSTSTGPGTRSAARGLHRYGLDANGQPTAPW